MSDITIAGTEIFESLSPVDMVARFNELEARTSSLSGKWLYKMFESKIYQDLGFSSFEKFVESELSISKRLAYSRKAEFKKTLISTCKVAGETEKRLNEDFIDVEIIEQLKSIPTPDHREFKSLNEKDRIKAVEAVVETGSKKAWVLYNVTGSTRKWIVENANSKTMSKYADEAHSLFASDRVNPKRRWDAFKQILKEEEKMKRKKEAKASEDAIPDRDESNDVEEDEPIEEQKKISYATIARGVLDTLADNDMNISSFRKALSKEIKIREDDSITG